MKKYYMLYDGRANYQNTDDCSVLLASDEMDGDAGEMFPGESVWFSYDEKDGELINETCEGRIDDIEKRCKI